MQVEVEVKEPFIHLLLVFLLGLRSEHTIFLFLYLFISLILASVFIHCPYCSFFFLFFLYFLSSFVSLFNFLLFFFLSVFGFLGLFFFRSSISANFVRYSESSPISFLHIWCWIFSFFSSSLFVFHYLSTLSDQFSIVAFSVYIYNYAIL